MKDLRDYIADDNMAEFDDEKVASNMYLTSLVKPLRSVYSEKNISREDDLKENAWLINDIPSLEDIGIVSMDQLKCRFDDDMNSCDGLLYNAGHAESDISILCEYKRANKRKVIQYINDKGKDGILAKVKGSTELLKKGVKFTGGFSEDELIQHLHLVIIYAQNDVVADAGIGKIERSKVERDRNGRQNKASRNIRFNMASRDKSREEALDLFSRELSSLGLIETDEDFFGISKIDPEAKKYKGLKSKQRQFSLISKDDLKVIVEEKKFFDGWNWGVYAALI